MLNMNASEEANEVDTSTSAENTFRRRLRKLEEQEGPLTDWDVATLLDCSQSHVRSLYEKPDEQVRPSYVLALEHARQVGIDRCQDVIETRPAGFRALVKDVTLKHREVARMLGIDTSTLYRYMDGERDLDVPRHHYLAALYIHELYKKDEEPEDCRRHIETYAST